MEGLGRRGSALSLVRRLSRMSVALRASCHPMCCSRGSYNFSPWRRRDGVLTPFGSAPVFWNKRARRAADPFCELGFTRWLRCARATRRATRSLHRQPSTLPFIVTAPVRLRAQRCAALQHVVPCCTAGSRQTQRAASLPGEDRRPLPCRVTADAALLRLRVWRSCGAMDPKLTCSARAASSASRAKRPIASKRGVCAAGRRDARHAT